MDKVRLTEKEEAESIINSFVKCLELFPAEIANRLEKLAAVNMVRVRYHHDYVSFTVGLKDINVTKVYSLMYQDIFLDLRDIGSTNRVEMFCADTVNQIKNEYSKRAITPPV